MRRFKFIRLIKRWRRQPRFYAWLVVGLMVIGLFCGYGWYRFQLRPVNRHNHLPVTFIINSGEGSSKIAASLESEHLIRNRQAFLLYVSLNRLRTKLESGYYLLSQAESAATIAKTIGGGRVVTNRLVIPEGATLAQVSSLMAHSGLSQASIDQALRGNYSYPFLANRPAGISLEGYLFPDTYSVTPNSSAQDVVTAMLSNFGNKVTPEIQQGLAAQGLSLQQGITLASIVEREVANAADRPIVAQVFLKRLKLGMPLESDVTVKYGASLLGASFSTQLDSPYNTYLRPGLPIGPICNPGLDAVAAIIHPAATDYLFFVSDSAGHTYFAKTLAGHEQNVRMVRPK